MKKPTKKDLFEFVYRADTLPKICTAERWLMEHRHLTSLYTLNELIGILNRTAKRLFEEQIAKYEQLLHNQNLELNRKETEAI